MPHVFIQEGGASNEFYVVAWDTEDQAHASRIRCGRDGAYRTTPIVEFPEVPDNTWDAIEDLLHGLDDLEPLDGPEGQDPTNAGDDNDDNNHTTDAPDAADTRITEA
ncbi:hypothetical protein [Nocardia puris]|uniref:Uncharacterized protein n=1 Tax=Nocardia puris TaxID=208602 RepID=A0A366CW91_9NOCA|nr:hypothetical protein [Nocardia puris]RBO79942.1 hypothetical protein DFR74_12918 [Nocardia puris]